MSEQQIEQVAETAEMIVSGYAFTVRDDGLISILNLNHPDCAMVVNRQGELVETNMDDLEEMIVLSLCKKNLQFLEG